MITGRYKLIELVSNLIGRTALGITMSSFKDWQEWINYINCPCSS
jgi:hypothetical protein